MQVDNKFQFLKNICNGLLIWNAIILLEKNNSHCNNCLFVLGKNLSYSIEGFYMRKYMLLDAQNLPMKTLYAFSPLFSEANRHEALCIMCSEILLLTS